MMLQMLLGGGGGGGAVVNPFPLTNVEDDQLFPVPGSASASFTVRVDGTMSVAGNGSSGGTNWYLPTSSGIGTGFWIRVTKTAGVANTSGSALGSWLAISGTLAWTWSKAGIGTLSATLDVDVATDALGANIVATRSGVPVLVIVAL